MWKEADKRVGFESIEKGDTFEKIVKEKVMPVIFKRAKLDPNKQKLRICTNCRWQPRSVGEIDLSIL